MQNYTRTESSVATQSLSFISLMAAQSLGALNDNYFKVLLSLIVLDQFGSDRSALYLSIAQALFILPNVLFAPYAGFFADRFSKTTILRSMKGFEVAVMLLALVGFKTGNVHLLFVLLALLGVHSTIFSPAKYGILPEMLPEEDLSRGNGYLEFFTFSAIIAGTALGGVLKQAAEPGGLPAYLLLLFAVLGLGGAMLIKKLPAASPNRRFQPNPFRELMNSVADIRCSKGLYLTLLAISYFWAIGVLFNLNLMIFAKGTLALSDLSIAFLLASVGLGIGIGSAAAGIVSRGKVELGLVPLGAVGIGVFAMLLGLAQGFASIVLVLLFFGMSSGFFIVPLNSYLQHESPAGDRGRFIAATNFFSYSAMLVSALAFYLLQDLLKFSAVQIFVISGALSLAVAIYVCQVLPEAFVRCLNWVLANVLYRSRVIGADNVPAAGGALLVANHVSYADPAMLLAALKRPVRFLMYRPIYQARLINPIAKIMRAIPIAPEDRPKDLVAALNEAREAVEAGELVCIFAEGTLTRIGTMLPFGRGLEHIMKGVDAPIIPIHLDEIWGSIFSFRDGRFFWKVPREIPYPITINIGRAMPARAKAFEVRKAIQELSAESGCYRQKHHRLLSALFLRTAQRFPWRTAVVDTTGRRLSYLKLLAAALSLSSWLRTKLDSSRMVGVMLPPSAAAAVANLALLFRGKTPVNLNFTASRESVSSAIRQCEISTVITSRVFVERTGVQDLPGPIFTEDLSFLFSGRRLARFLLACLIPPMILERLFLAGTRDPEAPATIIFSSGSTGEPKGVILSHSNVASNVESLYELFQLVKSDCIVGVLPFFHSFGFTGTLWLPLLAGIKAAYHMTPMDAAVIGELAEREKGSILLSTPTFLLGFLRKVRKEQFSNLRYVVVGAEKLKSKVAEAFQEKFGIAPLEGFGATELSPVAMLNVPDVEDGSVRQVGHKPGTVGHPIPGVAVKIIDPESFEALAPNSPGLLLIKGSNVMKGYLNDSAKTAEVLRDGWYVTGDIASEDEDGFVTITDRLSRFSKIGGEMVPHLRIEEEIQKLIGGPEQSVVVTGVPDEKKGEKLVVLLTAPLDAATAVRALAENGLPNLWIPKREDFYPVESFPLLGSGKLDLKELKRIALELNASRKSTAEEGG